MTKIIFILMLLFTFIASLQSCKDSKSKKPIEILAEASKDNDINIGNLNYKFTLPQDWYRIDTVLQNLYLCVLLNNDTTFLPRINIMTESMNGKSHNSYVNGTKLFLKNNMEGIQILENGKLFGSEKSCIWYSYNKTQNGVTRESIFYSVEINDISYNITAGFNQGGRRIYQKTVEDIVKSFRLE